MKRRLSYGFCVVAVTIGLVYSVSWYVASGARSLFSPDSLECKGQSEILLPFTELPIYRSQYRSHPRYKLVEYLVAKGYWSPRNVDHPRWIVMFHWNEQWRDGYSSVYSQLRHSADWIEWSEQHPEIASVLWPWVLAVLRNESRDKGCASELMLEARHASSVEDFQRSVESNVDLLAVCPDILSYAPQTQ